MAEANSTRTQLQAVPTIQQPDAFVEACKRHFGEHPEDVVEPLNSASEVLFGLNEIFRTIADEALKQGNGHRIKHLAEAGAHLASNIGEFTGRQYEAMTERLRDAGVIAETEGGAV